MENTLIFLKKLLHITVGIPLGIIPWEKRALTEFFQSNASYDLGDTDSP